MRRALELWQAFWKDLYEEWSLPHSHLGASSILRPSVEPYMPKHGRSGMGLSAWDGPQLHSVS